VPISQHKQSANNQPATIMNRFAIDEKLTHGRLGHAASLLGVQPIDEAAVVDFSQIV
jgi:hypothetical protein